MLCYKQNISKIEGRLTALTLMQKKEIWVARKRRKKADENRRKPSHEGKILKEYSYWGINKRRTDTVGSQIVIKLCRQNARHKKGYFCEVGET